ncbi:enoyl-CoA hydratase-related protein [Photobacterium lipolyticum]|uniref:Gamma-carboxygeranoyl-CoA hydratase n=1 Tax=Photobacterium lipolyticum TaxID=266810 RepID=A0A2T3MZM9_9GAMM|nr:enoyl-CoA hydratase-related protein [Photobacterium lipolyticum]PSW05424.1 gamma-carboxygeranoyl-CoA hydratase [Photobacterium lipolyticum]
MKEQETADQAQEVLCAVDEKGIATLTLNRTSKHNAFDDVVIQALLDHLDRLKNDPTVYVLVLRAIGKHFSTGADLNWMRSMAKKSVEENRQDAKQLAQLMHVLDTFPHPTIALVHGSAFGGALGLICGCDIAIASSDALFCLSEVKLGLIPATISPYVCRAMGVRQARRYMLTAEHFDAATARQLNIIHIVTDTLNGALEKQLTRLTQMILTNSPNAMTRAKQLCHVCEHKAIDSELRTLTSDLIAEIRRSEQGQEGVNAFFEKRPPAWSGKDE